MRTAACTLFLLSGAALSQSPEPQQPAPFRVSVTLVQIDAVATDSKGRHVTDLRPEEFEVRQDGRVQKIAHVSYVSTGAVRRPQLGRQGQDAPPVPAARLTAANVKRSIALIVDDLGMSFPEMVYVRKAMARFVGEQMGPDDLVAVLRTSGGMGALEQFTTDRRLLRAAIERIVWSPRGRQSLEFLPEPEPDAVPDSRKAAEARRVEAHNRAEEANEELFAAGTLGSVLAVVRGLGRLPGRKAAILFSGGIRIRMRKGEPGESLERLRRVADAANRASVVLYTVDSRGLTSFMPGADETNAPVSGPSFAKALAQRSADFVEAKNGLNFLAEQTGGVFRHDENDMFTALSGIAEDQAGYYSIGYSPEPGTFDRDARGRVPYHRISVKVTRPGVTLRSRNGFLGVPDEDAHPAPRTRDEQMRAAVTSPFAASGVRLRLTPVFSNTAGTGSFLTAMLYMDARDFTFREQPDGWKLAVIDLWISTFGGDGGEVDRTYKTYTLRLRGAEYERALEQGFVYVLNHPVKKPGLFQLRAAVRDTATERVGSAHELVEIPDLHKDRLALSGLILRTADGALAAATPAREGRMDEPDPMGSPAVRIFKPKKLAVYGVTVFHARRDKAAKKQDVATRVRVFRDGRQIYAGPERPVEAGQADPERLFAGGYLNIGADMAAGDYVLQVVATDRLAKERYRTAEQWIDFEVRR